MIPHKAPPGFEQDVDTHSRYQPANGEDNPCGGLDAECAAGLARIPGTEQVEIDSRRNDMYVPGSDPVVLDENAPKCSGENDDLARPLVHRPLDDELRVCGNGTSTPYVLLRPWAVEVRDERTPAKRACKKGNERIESKMAVGDIGVRSEQPNL